MDEIPNSKYKELFKKVLRGKVCPYCSKNTKLVDSIAVYKKSYGNIYLCEDCHAWVGTHKSGRQNKALGRIADAALRKEKIKAHDSFDKLWRKAMKKGRSKSEARGAAYKWLGEKMRIAKQYCHIGMMSEEECRLVVKLCAPYL